MSVTFRELEQQYGGFRRPILIPSVDGSADESPDLSIRRVELTLTAGYEAGVCTFELTGRGSAFEDGALKLDPAVRKYLKLGAALKLSMGYGEASACETVFSGYVTAAALKLEGSRIYHAVEAMDCKALMMNNQRTEILEGLTKDSEAVANVLKAYGSAASDTEVGATGERGAPIGRYGRSDYDFLVELARRNHYLFFVDRGKVRFIPYTGCTEVGVVLTPGSHLYRLERSAALSGQVKAVTVRCGGQAGEETPVAATAAQADAVGGGEKTAAAACSLVGEESTLTLIDGGARTEAQAKARAEAEWQRAAVGFISGSFETVGAPALRPGTLVTLEGFGAGADGDYLLTETIHRLDVGEYRTACKFQRSRD